MGKPKGDDKPAGGDRTAETFTKSLPVVLTKEELAERADRSANLIADRDHKEEEQKAANKHAKSVVESIDAEIRELNGEIRSRRTYKPTDCERAWDYAAGRYTETRLDTGEVLVDRPLTEAERQRRLFDQNGEGGGPGKGGGADPLPPAQQEEWRSVPVDKLTLYGLPQGGVDKIKANQAEPPLTTLGALSDWLNARPHRTIRDIAGFGDAMATKYEDAMETFWAEQKGKKTGK